jgi:hypothetical protein
MKGSSRDWEEVSDLVEKVKAPVRDVVAARAVVQVVVADEAAVVIANNIKVL